MLAKQFGDNGVIGHEICLKQNVRGKLAEAIPLA